MAVQPNQIIDQLFGERVRILHHPIHEVSDPDKIIGCEALMRGPKGSPYESPPLAFAMAATVEGLTALDMKCFESAMRTRPDGCLFVNIHPDTLAEGKAFWIRLGELARASVIQRIVVEIVEHSPYREENLSRAMLELKALGFGIAIDDLGEGKSGLRRIVEVAPEFIKIDRYFITGIDAHPRKQAVVSSVVRLADEIGSHVVAEGVETDKELMTVRRLGVKYAQGHGLSRPTEADQDEAGAA